MTAFGKENRKQQSSSYFKNYHQVWHQAESNQFRANTSNGI